MAVRVCAYKKTAAQTRAAVKSIEQESRKKNSKVKPETLEAAGYVIVLTTLLEPSADEIMEFYRKRWQVELAFKRLKSLLQLGHLKKADEQGAKAWLQGKLMVACLIESLILTAERFSPWGYKSPPTRTTEEALPLA
jgi:transposase